MQFLHSFFRRPLNCLGLWPPHSTDLTPPDFFLCSYLKNSIYKTNPFNLKALKTVIMAKLADIDVSMLHHVLYNMEKHVEAGIVAQRDHFQHLL